MCLCHVAEGARGAEVADGIAGGVGKDIVGDADECVFLAEHVAVLADDGKTVDVGVNYESDIGVAAAHEVGDSGEIFGDGLGSVREIAGGGAVELDDFLHAERAEELRDDDATNGVHRVDSDGETGFGDSLAVDERQGEHLLDVPAVVGGVGVDLSEIVDFCESELSGVGYAEHLGAFLRVEELAFLVEKLEGVPLAGIVRCGEDESAACVLAGDGKLGGGR